MQLAEGSTYEIPEILFATDGDKRFVGQPTVTEVKITAKVLTHGRDPKIMVFRKKRRKGFAALRGHRQGFTLLQIDTIQGMTVTPKEKPAPRVKMVKPKVEAAPAPEKEPKAKAKAKTAAKPKAKAKKQEK